MFIYVVLSVLGSVPVYRVTVILHIVTPSVILVPDANFKQSINFGNDS